MKKQKAKKTTMILELNFQETEIADSCPGKFYKHDGGGTYACTFMELGIMSHNASIKNNYAIKIVIAQSSLREEK